MRQQEYLSLQETNLSLQKTIESRIPEPFFTAAVTNSVMATTTTTRGLDDPPRSLENASHPQVKARNLVGELLLCFRLLNDLLGYHMAVTRLTELSSMGYDKLRSALEETLQSQTSQSRTDFMDAPIDVKIEAVENLYTRLREIARIGYLNQRKQERFEGKDSPRPTQSYSMTESDTADNIWAGVKPRPMVNVSAGGRSTIEHIEIKQPQNSKPSGQKDDKPYVSLRNKTNIEQLTKFVGSVHS